MSAAEAESVVCRNKTVHHGRARDCRAEQSRAGATTQGEKTLIL